MTLRTHWALARVTWQWWQWAGGMGDMLTTAGVPEKEAAQFTSSVFLGPLREAYERGEAPKDIERFLTLQVITFVSRRRREQLESVC